MTIWRLIYGLVTFSSLLNLNYNVNAVMSVFPMLLTLFHFLGMDRIQDSWVSFVLLLQTYCSRMYRVLVTACQTHIVLGKQHSLQDSVEMT